MVSPLFFYATHLARHKKKAYIIQMDTTLTESNKPAEADWPGIRSMPEYNNMLRLDKYPDSLYSWLNSRIRSPQAYDLLTRLFKFNPDKRITAKEALDHRWFHEEPKTHRK